MATISVEYKIMLEKKTPLQIMVEMVKSGEMQPSELRDRLTNQWGNINIVAALILTMIRFTHAWGCTTEEDASGASGVSKPSRHHGRKLQESYEGFNAFCTYVHPLLAALSLSGTLYATLFSLCLYIVVSQVPDKHLTSFLDKFGFLSKSVTKVFLLALLVWIIDEIWAGILVHGLIIGSIAGTMLLGVIIYFQVMMNKMIKFLHDDLVDDLGSAERGDAQ